MTIPAPLSSRSLVMREPAKPALRRTVKLIELILQRTTKVVWQGLESIPSGGVVIASNHISYFDFATLGHFVASAGRWPYFLAKESVFRIPLIGRLISACGQIPVYRDQADGGNALAAAEAAINEGKALLIYPEGTVTKDPQLWPMKGRSGAVRLALRTGCPIIPVAQWGAQRVIPPPGPGIPRLLPRKTIQVLAGPPLDLTEFRDQPITPELLTAATQRLMTAITDQLSLLRQARPEIAQD